MIYWDASLDDIKEYCLQGNEIICFGSGKAFYKFLSCLDSVNLINKIKTVVDNNTDKQGENVYWNSIKICHIISLSELIELDLSRIVMIITASDFKDIIDQLLEYPKLNSVLLTYYGFIKDNIIKKDIMKATQAMLEIPQGQEQIPRVIHYCWFGRKDIPKQQEKWMESWTRFCPDYEIVRWDESNYDVHKIPYISEAYNSAKYSFVSDYARLDVLYKYGGIYLDTDVEVLKPLDDLLCQKAFMGIEFPANMVATGLGVGTIANHKTIKLLMDDYENRHFVQKDGTLDLTTCPVIQSNTLSTLGFRMNGSRQTIAEIEIYPYVMFSPFVPYSRRIIYNDVSYLCHHYAASWVDSSTMSKAKTISRLYRLFNLNYSSNNR